jgi:hypothetical protein
MLAQLVIKLKRAESTELTSHEYFVQLYVWLERLKITSTEKLYTDGPKHIYSDVFRNRQC